MATPSEATLRDMLDLEPADARDLKAALVEADGAGPKKVDVAMQLADELMEAYGIEAIRIPGAEDDRYYGDIVALYVNTGDTYNGTLLYDVDKRRFYATTYGDWLQSQEQQGRYIPNAGAAEKGMKWQQTDVKGSRLYWFEIGGGGGYTVDRTGPNDRWEALFLAEGSDEPEELGRRGGFLTATEAKQAAEEHFSRTYKRNSGDELEEADNARREAAAELSRLEAAGIGRESAKYRRAQKAHVEATKKGDFLRARARAQRKKKRSMLQNPGGNKEIPIANPDDAEWIENLWLLQFGAVGTQPVYVWADSADTAFEVAVDWLDENEMCGYFTTVTEGDLRDAARDLGIAYWPGIDAFSGSIGRGASQILEHAEMDLTVIGHTTIKCVDGPAYIPSHEWFIDEVTRRATYDEVKRRSLSKPVRLSYAVQSEFSQYWGGQGDPLYAVLSRRGTSVDWVTVDASPEEISRLEQTAETIIEDDDKRPGAKRAAEALLKQLEELE
jgi:hypothetical protein